MRWYVSYSILAAGLALGADILFPDAPVVSRAPAASSAAPVSAHTTEAHLALASEIEFASRLAAFSPGAQLLSSTSSRVSVLDYLAQKLAPLDFAPAVTTPATAQPLPAGTWKSVVVREAQPVYQRALLDARAADAPREALARDIQTELTRVGCYFGEIDGVWGIGSRRAVLTFMDRINASLPTHEPDVFMLSLLRAETAPVCGQSCPSGQTLASNGRCVPATLVAHETRMPHEVALQQVAVSETEARAEPAATSLATVAEEVPVLVRAPAPYFEGRPSFEGRMGMGGPKPDDEAPLPPDDGLRSNGADTPAPLTRSAALDGPAAGEPASMPPESLPRLTTSSFDREVAPRPRKSAKAPSNRSKSAGRSRSGGSYRQVQHLFEHPLGRM